MKADRLVLEQLGQAIAAGFERALGAGIDIGLHGRFDDEDVASRALPVRASLVEFDGELDDVMIVVGSFGEDALRSATQTAVAELLADEDLAVTATAGEVEIHAYETHDEALEQLEALVGASTVNFHTPRGDLLVVMGEGLMASASRALDPSYRRDKAAALAEAEREQREAEQREAMQQALLARQGSGLPMQADVSQFSVTDPEVAALLGIDVASRTPDSVGSGGGAFASADEVAMPMATPAPAAPAAAGGGGGWDVSDPEVAALLGLDTGPAQVMAPTAGSTAYENAAAAGTSIDRWQNLLSGVEVEVSAELGSTRMRLGDATALTPESVLTLDQSIDDPVTVYVNGTLFATARLVVVDDEYGIEILEVLHGAAAQVAQLAA